MKVQGWIALAALGACATAAYTYVPIWQAQNRYWAAWDRNDLGTQCETASEAGQRWAGLGLRARSDEWMRRADIDCYLASRSGRL